jgi:predicted nuclease of predicted toxin-antitoxin system
MIFFLDENFPKPAVRVLADRGHSSVDIRGTGQEGASDDSLFRLAQEAGAVLLTTDKDFFHTIPLAFQKHNGCIVIALAQPNRSAILSKLDQALRYVEQHGIANQSLLLTDRKMYLR